MIGLVRTVTQKSRGPGRPKDLEKRAAIVAAAAEFLLKQGFDGLTIETVATQAGVSKMTVYSHFEDKDALFEAAVLATTDEIARGMLKQGDVTGDLKKDLNAFGRSLLGALLTEPLVSKGHALIGALADKHAVAERFYNAGPGQTMVALEKMLASAQASGELVMDDPHLAAEDLISLWLGDLRILLMLKLVDPMTPVTIARRVKRGTRVFLRAYQAR
jgi:TetR/AcrR family transcriptional repressor of mexJK operon